MVFVKSDRLYQMKSDRPLMIANYAVTNRRKDSARRLAVELLG
ncbi:hypothetical protein ACQFX9_23345 [Aliinostoc sp. HNIBRCY26]